MAAKKTWFLIADAGRARVLERIGHQKTLQRVDGFDFTHPLPKTSDMVRDRQPRTFDSVGEGRHAISKGVDPRRAKKETFAITLGEALDHALAKGSFDALVVVAPPQMLGDLRLHLSDKLKEVLTRDVALDLTNTPDADILPHLEAA